MNRTIWYPAKINPVHKGNYECRWKTKHFEIEVYFNYWDGNRWHFGNFEPTDNKYDPIPHCYMDVLIKWRGLAEKPGN